MTTIINKNEKVSIVLPSYNEKNNISEAIERISKSLGEDLLEIIVVDDNSPDGTWKIVENIHKTNSKVKLIRRMNKRGLASALADGIEKTKGNVIVWMDCDLGLPPEDIPRLVEKLNGYDVSIGSRYVKGGKDLRSKPIVMLSVLFNLYCRLILGSKVKDYTSGFVAVKKDVLKEVQWSKNGFGEYFIEFAYKSMKKKFKITEVGYVYRNRKSGVSKLSGNTLSLIKNGFKYGIKVLELRFNNL